jgi:hypothetical protein
MSELLGTLLILLGNRHFFQCSAVQSSTLVQARRARRRETSNPSAATNPTAFHGTGFVGSRPGAIAQPLVVVVEVAWLPVVPPSGVLVAPGTHTAGELESSHV